MRENSYHQDKDKIKELLNQYQNLKSGKSHSYLDEDSFERIIDYFDDAEDLPQAIEAVDIAIEQYPYSSLLQLKKADLLIAVRRYGDALTTLDQAAAHLPGISLLKIDVEGHELHALSGVTEASMKLQNADECVKDYFRWRSAP